MPFAKPVIIKRGWPYATHRDLLYASGPKHIQDRVIMKTPTYAPAPYLLSNSVFTTPQLVSQFQDFWGSIEHVSTAPGLVFDRLVAGLSGTFTAALEQERHQHAAALGKSQDENEKLRLLNEQLGKELAELKEMTNPSSSHSASHSENNNVSNAVVKREAARNPTIGSFSTAELRSWKELRDKTSRVVSFASPYSALPGLPIGLTKVDINNNQNVRVNSYASDIKKDRFDIHIDTWGGTSLHSASCAWLEVEANDPDFQFGKFNTLDDYPWTSPQMLTTRLINFPRRYSKPPKVVVWLAAFDIKHDKNWRVKTYATSITATSFTIHVDTWSDTVLYSATASWVAYPADKPDIFSGSFSTTDMRPYDSPQLRNSGYVKFGNNTFSAPPRTILAINSIDICCKKNLRLELKASSINDFGMTWHINSWGDTILYSAGASYIALG